MLRSAWFEPIDRPESPGLQVFCFHSAGCSASMFRLWKGIGQNRLKFTGVQLPGRERRFGEPAYRRVSEIAPALAEQFISTPQSAYCFFGHSFGALVAFETARELQRRAAAGPLMLFVAALRAPHLPPRNAPIHQLPDREFLLRLVQLGGMDSNLASQPELLEPFLHTIRADFEAVETYSYLASPRLNRPILAFAGASDEAHPPEEVGAWRELTNAPFELITLPGGHFFLQDASATLAAAMIRKALPFTSSQTVDQ